MFMKIENTIINLTEIQSIKPLGNSIEIIFINGKTINISTKKYDYIINGPGRTTNTMYEELVAKDFFSIKYATVTEFDK